MAILSMKWSQTKVVSSLEFRVEQVLGGILVFLEASMVLSLKSQIAGRIQNMDPKSMDHPCGPGPWTTFVDPVHGPPLWTTPNFINLTNRTTIKLQNEID